MMTNKPTLHLKSPLKAVPESLKVVRASIRAEERALIKARKREEDKALRALIKMLSKHFPQCFNFKYPKPLKIGIHQDIVESLGETLALEPQLISALKYYTRNLDYHRAVIKESHRYDLNGKEAQALTPRDKQYSQDTLNRLQQKIQAIREKNRKPKLYQLSAKYNHAYRSNAYNKGRRYDKLSFARVG